MSDNDAYDGYETFQEYMIENGPQKFEIIVTENGEGKAVEFYHIGTIDYNEKWYVFLQPVIDLGATTDILKDGDLVIFEMVDGKDGDNYVQITNEKLFNEIYDEFARECQSSYGCDEDDEEYYDDEY